MPLPPLSRRSFLRAGGVSLALPALEAMLPRCATAMAPKAPRRMVAIQTNMGILPQNFFPKETGKNYTLTPYLQILKAHHDKLTVLSGVSHPDVDGAHEAEKAFLTATPHPGSAAFKSTISLDQLAAERLGPITRFSSFTLGVNPEATQGMSYSRSGVKVPTEKSPAALYGKMFLQGKATEVDERIADLQRGRSLLDFVGDRAKTLNRDLSPSDRQRMDQYFTAVRELEVQLQQAQAWERQPKPKAPNPEPKDITEAKQMTQRVKLMLDVVKMAIETDSTRIVSLFINTFSVVPEVPGVKEETHSLTHHGNRPEALDQLFRIESALFQALASFLDGLSGTKEDTESLLDRTMVLYGTPMGSANSHANTNLPVLLAGGGFKHAGHLAFDAKKNYPLPNLYVSMLQKMGLEVDRFASSTGTMRGLDI